MKATTVFEQNIITVASLKAKNFSDAIKASAAALACQQQKVADARTGALALQESFNDSCLDHCMVHSKPSDEAVRVSSVQQHSFVYQSAILLPPGGVHPTIATSILVFNAALAHHLLAESIDYVPTSHETLRKAMRLYQVTFQFAAAQENCGSILFRFVVRNNIAAIEQQLGIISPMNEYFMHIKSVKELIDLGCILRLRHLEDFLKQIPTTSEAAPVA